MLVFFFGWLPSYQFTFGSLQILALLPASSSEESGRSSDSKSAVTIGDLFSDKYTTDTWVYYICSTAVVLTLLALTESVRARVILSPIFNRILQNVYCCRSPESLKHPQVPAQNTDDDVRMICCGVSSLCSVILVEIFFFITGCVFQVIREELRIGSIPASKSHGPSSENRGYNQHLNEPKNQTPLLPLDIADIVMLRSLKKTYPATRKAPAVAAVHSLSLGIPKGEVFGLLGSNGAGKTTTIDMITNVLLPSSGCAEVAGTDVHGDPESAYRIMGYCPQFSALWDDVTVLEHLRIFGRIGGLVQPSLDTTSRDMMTAMSLTRYAEVLAGHLSGGNKRKLSFAIAMLASPQVVLLDEPSSGMDPASRKFMHQIISSVKAASRAVILTTHSMEEADALCTRIGIMAKGQMRCLGSSVHLKQKHGKGFIIVLQTDPAAAEAAITFVLRAFPGAQLTHNNMGHMSFNALRTDMKLSTAYSAIDASVADLGILRYSVLQPTLEQVFLSVSAEAAAAAEAGPPIGEIARV
jgi:ABC-type multidrug transport system ATPase subunit